MNIFNNGNSLLIIIIISICSINPIHTKHIHNDRKTNNDDLPLLLLISFDGFRWDYLENNTLPNLNEYFVNDGVKANRGIKNSFSTVTFPNHWTIATGLYPESHGIVANVMYDSILNQTYYDFGPLDNDTRWFGQNKDAVPIWIQNQLADNNRRRSGIIGAFPGCNVPIIVNNTNHTAFVTYDYKLEDPLNWFIKVDKLVSWFLDKENPINFGVLYFPEPDSTGHAFGPYSKEIKQVLYNIDYIVGYLIQELIYYKLYDKMNIILTSDHGMDTASLNNSINLNDYVDITKFKSYGGLTEISIYPNNPNDTDEIYNGLKNIKNYNVYKKDEIPDYLNYKHNVRIGPIVMFGDVGYEIFRANKSKHDWTYWNGDHGGDNRVETMHPVFIARGPRFKKNYTAKQFNNTDLYELMCAILNISPTINNGSFDNVKDMLIDNDDSSQYIDYHPIYYLVKHEYTLIVTVKIREIYHSDSVYLINFLLISLILIAFYLLKHTYKPKSDNFITVKSI